MTGPRWRNLVAGVVAIIAVAACNGDDSSSSSTLPLPTPPPSTVPADDSTTSMAAPETTPSAPSTTEQNPVPTLSLPSTTTTVPSILPPVDTLVPQVPDELLTPAQLDPTNPNNSRPILPEHLPVLEAHLRAIQASTLVSATWPIDPDAPELIGAPFSPEALQAIQEGGRGRLARGEVLNVSQGVTFRPYVVGSVADTAIVFDCELAGHYWTKAESGELLPPTEIWPAGPGRVVELGLRVNLVLRDGKWLVDASQIHPGACARDTVGWRYPSGSRSASSP